MNDDNLYALGMVIILMCGFYYYLSDGNPLLHFSSIVWIIFGVGIVMVNTAFIRKPKQGGRE